MNFGGNNFDSGMKSMRSPASGRGNSQALVFRGQQSPGQHDHHQQQQQQQRQHNNSGGGTGGHTPNSRYNTPSKGLPKSSYLQRRTPGATPGTNERTPGTGGTTPYNANNSSSRMSTGFQSSPGSGLTTPGRRGGGRLSLLGSDSRSQYSYQQDYSKMDETLTGGGGDLFNRDSVDQDDYNHHNHSANYHNASTPRGGYTSTDLGMRQRRGLSTPSGNTSSEGAVMDSQSATNSLHPHWVIVFGLPAHAPDDSPCSTTNVLKLFQGYGEIDNYHTSPGNWLLIKFSSSLDANNAAGVLHRTFLTSEVMIGVESLTPSLAKKLNLTFQVDGQLVITPGKPKKQFSRVEQQGKAQGALLDPDYDNIMRPPRKVTKDICTRIFEFFMY